MNKPAFTPGPWYVSQSDAPGCGLLVKPMLGQIVAECDPVPEMDANARLIAAAPELHAALRTLVDVLRFGNQASIDNALTAGLKALAKAVQPC